MNVHGWKDGRRRKYISIRTDHHPTFRCWLSWPLFSQPLYTVTLSRVLLLHHRLNRILPITPSQSRYPHSHPLPKPSRPWNSIWTSNASIVNWSILRIAPIKLCRRRHFHRLTRCITSVVMTPLKQQLDYYEYSPLLTTKIPMVEMALTFMQKCWMLGVVLGVQHDTWHRGGAMS